MTLGEVAGICRAHARAAGALLAGVALAACTTGPPPRPLDAIAEDYVRVTLQLDQHNRSLVDSWRGPDAWRPGPRVPVAELQARVAALSREVGRVRAGAGTPDALRRRYLGLQLSALAFVADRLMGASPADIREEASRLLAPGGTPRNADRAEAAATREAIAAELPGPGSLAERYQAFRQGFVVADAARDAVMTAALDACRGRTEAVMPLPPDEHVDVDFVHGLSWDGQARYLGQHRTRIDVNADAPLDITRALRLACHEGYPGHHVQYLWLDDHVASRGWPEAMLVPAFGVHVLVAEGAAEAGADLAFPPTERAALYRDRLLPAAGLPAAGAERLVRVEELVKQLAPTMIAIASDYLGTRISEVAAVDRLRNEALVPDPEGLLAFSERRRSLLLAYPEGAAYVRSQLATQDLAGLYAWLQNTGL